MGKPRRDANGKYAGSEPGSGAKVRGGGDWATADVDDGAECANVRAPIEDAPPVPEPGHGVAYHFRGPGTAEKQAQDMADHIAATTGSNDVEVQVVTVKGHKGAWLIDDETGARLHDAIGPDMDVDDGSHGISISVGANSNQNFAKEGWSPPKSCTPQHGSSVVDAVRPIRARFDAQCAREDAERAEFQGHYERHKADPSYWHSSLDEG